MNGKIFVDTNILIYAHDKDAGEKHLKARDLIKAIWNEGNGTLSTQVLQEFYITVRRKIPQPIFPSQARGIIESYLVWEVIQNDANSILKASEIEERYQISFWDALIIAAAIEANAERVLTEDLNDGQLIEGVLIVNPFYHGQL
jgi:predicted nucleic acid-binding protein